MDKTTKSLENIYGNILLGESTDLTKKTSQKVNTPEVIGKNPPKKAAGTGPEAVKGLEKPKELKHKTDAEPEVATGSKAPKFESRSFESAFERAYQSAICEDEDAAPTGGENIEAGTESAELSDLDEAPEDEESAEGEENEESKEESLVARLEALQTEISSILADLKGGEEAPEEGEEGEEEELENEFGDEEIAQESYVNEGVKSNVVKGKLSKKSGGKVGWGPASGKVLSKSVKKGIDVKSNIKKGRAIIG